jgi:hypothetical protein
MLKSPALAFDLEAAPDAKAGACLPRPRIAVDRVIANVAAKAEARVQMEFTVMDDGAR